MSDEIRVGDRFLVEVEVRDPCKGYDRVEVVVQGQCFTYIWRPALILGKRLPRSIKVGDEVLEKFRDPHVVGVGTVIAIDDTVAWVLYDNGVRRSPSLSDLTLVDGEEP